jgi:hypothetical protein
MLTSLDFLNPGRPWPPPEERERLKLYQDNKDIFEGRHDEVYREAFKRIERVIGNFQEVVSYPIILNYQKKISLKITDMLFGEMPGLTAGDPESLEQKIIEKAKEEEEIINISIEAGIDVSRYGTGLFYVSRRQDGKASITITRPGLWFPVVNPDNIKEVLFHILAWPYVIETIKGKQKFLKVQIHERGFYTEKIYTLVYSEYASIGEQIGRLFEEKRIGTGLSGFAIVPVHNIMTSDRVVGMDDYSEIDSIISELMVRVAQISRILDKHSAPSVQGPHTALEQDPASGLWRLKMGNYFPRVRGDDPKVEYLTWDAQLNAAFKQIEVLTNQLYTISEMGSAIFGDLGGKTGQIPSGAALKRLMVSALAKVNRIRMKFDPALKRVLKLYGELSGVKIENISITWQDGLPGDPLEEANIINLRTGGKPTMSQRRAIKQYDGLTGEEAEAELELLAEEEIAANPLAAPIMADIGGIDGDQVDQGADQAEE